MNHRVEDVFMRSQIWTKMMNNSYLICNFKTKNLITLNNITLNTLL